MSSTTNIRKSVFELLIRVLFVVLPTMAVSAYVLGAINLSYTGFDSGTVTQYAYLFSGILVAYILSWMRGRFLVWSLIVLGALWIAKAIVANLPGEFDVFYAQARYWLYATLFTIGWLTGFLISRSRLYVVVYCGLLMLLFILFLSDAQNINVTDWTEYLLPVFLYSVYMFFLVPQMLSAQEWNTKKTARWVSLVGLFILLAAGAFYAAREFFRSDIEATQRLIDNRKSDEEDKKENGGQNNGLGPNYDERNGLMERGGKPDDEKGESNTGGKDEKDPKDKDDQGKDPKDGKDDKSGQPKDNKGNKSNKDQKGGKEGEEGDDGYRMKDSMKMGEKQSQSDVLMFCARLENYFPDGTPQPLYFVYHYLTKYDPKTETFVRDPFMPMSDELPIDPSKVDMYRTKTDSTAIRNSFATKKRKVVEADVFISSTVWKHSLLAPSAPFSVQTIPVDTGYKDLFRSGYHVRSYSSELNNAYLVYNPSANPMIAAYQQERVDELSSITDYKTMDSLYYAYYTQLPKGSLFDSIRVLALQVTATAKTPIEKVMAIRDYFLSTKPDGSLLYRYTLDPGAPGDPNIPTGGMLRNFLFKTHEGYCTYFAGASTLMLQAVGVPARFTTGFATIDRSDKNKGWYWFYASQAHAWTQVYFPEYGWLDFDMTISSEEEGGPGEAPKPDGTPPVPPPQPWLILDGVITEEPEPNSGKISIRFRNLIFFNDEYHLDVEQEQEIDASLCRFVYGTIDTTFNAMHKGDSVFVVSWDDAAKDVPDPDPTKSIEEQMRNFVWPMIADEIYIQKKIDPKKDADKKKDEEKKTEAITDYRIIWYILLAAGIVIIISVIFFPLIYLARLRAKIARATTTKEKAEAVYRAALYTFHMSGQELRAQTALSYAQERVDPAFGTSFADFVRVYLRLKYSPLPVEENDNVITQQFNSDFRTRVRSKLDGMKAALRWFNLARALRFFRTPEALTEQANHPYGE